MIEVKYSFIGNIESREHFIQAVEQIPECSAIRLNGECVRDPSDTIFSYTKSQIDGSDKWTEETERCIIPILSGKARNGDALSYMLHISPAAFDTYHYSPFRDISLGELKKEYARLLSEFAEKTQEDTRSILIAGGSRQLRYALEDYNPLNFFRYGSMARWVSRMHRKILHTPSVILPPKKFSGRTYVYFNTNQEIAHVVEAKIS